MSDEKKQFIKRWLIQRRRLVAFFIFLGFVMLIVGYAFNTMTSSYYLLVLYAVLVLAYLFSDLLIEWFRLKELRHSAKTWQELLQETAVLSESEYWLMEECAKLSQTMAGQSLTQQQFQQEQLDYYTMWVHQIKTSIAASQLLIQALPTLPEKAPLEQELIKITTYTDFVLHYVRMETFHRDLVLKNIVIDDIVKQVLKKYATFFIYKKIQLEYQPIEESLITDSKWFSVIVEQLLSNAIKYTDSGGSIRIFMQQDCLCVQDSGIGIAQADQKRIFERGFSGFNGRMNYHSSGLGLYLSNEIAKKLGVTLSVESVVGEGTTMKIHLKQEELQVI